jgi:hypothetical protein
MVGFATSGMRERQSSFAFAPLQPGSWGADVRCIDFEPRYEIRI